MIRLPNSLRLLAAGIALSTVALASTQASAVSLSVQLACAADYYSYCSKHDPDSQATRSCMRANGLKLSNRCVNALVKAGEVSKEEVSRRAAAAGR